MENSEYKFVMKTFEELPQKQPFFLGNVSKFKK